MTVPTLVPDVEKLHRNWGWFLGLGIVLIVLGLIGLSYSVILTVTSVFLFGCLLLGSGCFHLVSGSVVGRWGGFLLHSLAGVLELIVGLLIVTHPLEAAVELTLLFAVLLMVGGLLRCIVAFEVGFSAWGWVFFSGVIDVVLGLMIWRQWPVTGLWFIGFCVALNLLFQGWSWVMIALTARNARPATPAPA